MERMPRTRQEFKQLDFMSKSKLKKRLVTQNLALLTQHLNPNILVSFRPVLHDNDYEEIDLMRDYRNRQGTLSRLLTEAMRSLKTGPSWFDILDDVLRDNREYLLYDLLNPWDRLGGDGEGGGERDGGSDGGPHRTVSRGRQPATVAAVPCTSLDPQTEGGHQPQSGSWQAAEASNAYRFPATVTSVSCSREVGHQPVRLLSQVDCDGEPSLGEPGDSGRDVRPSLGEPGDSGHEADTIPLVLDAVINSRGSHTSVIIENKYYFQDKIETATFMVGERNTARVQPGPAPGSASGLTAQEKGPQIQATDQTHPQLQNNDLPYQKPVSEGAGGVRHSETDLSVYRAQISPSSGPAADDEASQGSPSTFSQSVPWDDGHHQTQVKDLLLETPRVVLRDRFHQTEGKRLVAEGETSLLSVNNASLDSDVSDRDDTATATPGTAQRDSSRHSTVHANHNSCDVALQGPTINTELPPPSLAGPQQNGQADVISDEERAPARAARGRHGPPGLVRVIAWEVLRQLLPYT